GSANLQLEVIKDQDLRPLLNLPARPTGDDKRAAVLGLIINHYALIYDLKRLGGIPEDIWMTFEKDLRDAASGPLFRGRWAQLKHAHRPDFVDLVENMLRQKPAQ